MLAKKSDQAGYFMALRDFLRRPVTKTCILAFTLWTGLWVPSAWARGHVLAPVPPKIASNHFMVTIDGQKTPVMHAAQNLYFKEVTL